MKKYLKIRNSISSGDLLEWRSKSFIGWLIRFFSKNDKNHSSLCFGLDKYLRYKKHRKFILEADASGVNLRLLSRELNAFTGEVYYYKLKSKYDKYRPAIERWACTHAGSDYDFGSLFKNAACKTNADIRKFICSEYVFCAMVAAGVLPQYKITDKKVIDRKGRPVKSPRPGDFSKFGIFEKPIRIL
jgi:hypothetical protein